MFGRKRPISDKRFAKLLAQLADFEEPETAIEAAKVIESLDDRTRLPELYRILKETDDFCVREAVGTAICRMDGLKAVPELVAAMQLDSHDFDGLRTRVYILIESDRAAAAPLLLAQFRSGAPELRPVWANWLGYVAEVIEPEPLLQALRSEDRKLRAAALSALVAFKGRPELFAMFEHLALHDPDEQTRRTSIAGLLYSDNPAATPTIEAARHDPSAYVRDYAEYALEVSARKQI